MKKTLLTIFLVLVLAFPIYAQVTAGGVSISGVARWFLSINTDTMTGNVTLTVADDQIQSLDPTADRDLTLPAEAVSSGLTFIIKNVADGADEVITIKNDAPATIGYLYPEEIGIYSCDGTSWVGATLHPSAGPFSVDGVANTATVNSAIVSGGANTFNITNGTASLDVAAGSTVNVDANLTVEAASAVNQDLTTDAAGVEFASISSTPISGDTGSFSTLATSAGVIVDYAAVSDAARTNTALSTDHIVAWTALSATRNYQISSEDIAQAGRVFIIKDESGDAGTHALTVSTEGAEKIDGADSISINANYGSVQLYSNGSHLFVY